ncbi:TetR/AcrR family transcriptional regulator [Adlercreutzia sp. R25]|uniref:TetR/AcrR family transcriptional regulator n=1 Tax=Adlercreutzia shanghongiae TaxID=3111773 RepID=A0ABU6J140_9ACTN|nr:MULTISPECIES: TetR/AcrR family transcriptional regulator [unclassified Adlercreutzia]MEC4273779.1 TetR/AcrR family transcriptional regulator [Adlercreutzia sp. R25]MEC4295857.1 TetR/AcrR family transcriptional regulator [Adlercreutzia sp. R22]
MKDTPSDIRKAVEQSFKQLIAQKGYRSISVTDIAELARISRHTFYEYFANKEAVVASLFYQDAIKPLEDAHALFSLKERMDIPQITERLLGKMYQGVYDNREFYARLVTSLTGSNDVFVQVVTNAICIFNVDLMGSLGYAGTAKEIDYAAFIFGSSQAMLMQRWISSGFDMSVEEITALYSQVMTPFWLNRMP